MNRYGLLSLAILLLVFLILPPTPKSFADPILKPRKYSGPIPRRSFSLNVGFLAGPKNEQMYDYLDRQVEQPLRNDLATDDFGSALQLDGAYTVKVHPQFALRAKAGVGLLGSTSKGLDIPSAEQDTSGLFPLLTFKRTFDVVLSSIEASAIYYFQDASIDEFQTYTGGGFSFFFPYARYEESTTNTDTKKPFSRMKKSKFSAEPGVHAVLGFLYHIRNKVALQAEARVQIGQSKFIVNLPTDSGIQPLTFDVDYTGFVMTVGVSRFF